MTAPRALIVDLLRWLDARERTYRETMDAWRTSCPRLPVWEDAGDGRRFPRGCFSAWEYFGARLDRAGRNRSRPARVCGAITVLATLGLDLPELEESDE